MSAWNSLLCKYKRCSAECNDSTRMGHDVNFNSSFPIISYHINKISTLEDGEIGHLCAYKRFDKHHSLQYIRAPYVYHVDYDVE